jgi:hypothetical protein
MKTMKSNTLDEGTMAFMQWLSSKDKQISNNNNNNNPIILKQFVKGKYTVLLDNYDNSNFPREIIVEIKEGVPICKGCQSDDCAHVGFTICIEQFYECGGNSI